MKSSAYLDILLQYHVAQTRLSTDDSVHSYTPKQNNNFYVMTWLIDTPNDQMGKQVVVDRYISME